MDNLARKQEAYTLAHLFAAAGVRDDLPFARGIVMSKTPKKHQVTGLNQMLTQPNERFGLFDETGCMKTLPSQAFCLYHAGMGNKVVIVMPPILLEQFEESLTGDFLGVENYISWHILSENPAKRDKLFARFDAEGWPDMLMMTYQMFSKIPRKGRKKDKTTNKFVSTPARPQDHIASELSKRDYNVLVCDEAHMLRNHGSGISNAVKLFMGAVGEKAMLLMTGTPAFNTLEDTYSLIKFITPEKYASKRSFQRMHCVYTTDNNGWSRLIGFQNKDVLHSSLYSQARRVTKDQVLNLKEPQIIEVPVNLSTSHHTLYQRLVRERMLELSDTEIITALTQQALREACLQIVTTPELFTSEKIENSVIETVDELVDSIGPMHEKIVLFATHQNTVRKLADHYAEYKALTVYGGNGGSKANRRNVEIFKTDPECRILVMHPNSGGVGLNLQDVCRYMIFVEPLSVPGQFKQAADRIHRGEIEHVVTFYLVKVRGTLGPRLIRQMLEKDRDIVHVTRDRKSMLAELLDE